MTQAGKKSARELALQVIKRVEKDQAYLDRLVDYYLERTELDPRDRALFTELAYGSIRHQRLLDFDLEQFLDRKISQTDLTTRNLLRLGAYQILFLDRIPAHAAVNESVRLSVSYARPLLNAVLRRLSENKNTLKSPDQIPDPATRLGVKYSHPDWMVESAIQELGAKEAEELLNADNQRPMLTLRVNPLRLSREELLAFLEREGIPAGSGKFSPWAIRIKEHKSPILLPGYQQGWFAIQDEASQLVVMILDPQPGERILDACSAPGTKTLQIFQLMQKSGKLISADLNENRLNLIHPEAERLGLTGFQTLAQDLTEPLNIPENELGRFDKILLDAPCSGLGAIRKHPEIKWQRKREDISALADLQGKLIKNLAQYLKPGGVLVYSTCTWTREENQEVVSKLIASGEFKLEDPKPFLPDYARTLVNDKILQTWPHRDSIDAFRAFRLRRK